MNTHDIISILDIAASDRLPVAVRNGLCEIKRLNDVTAPAYYSGGSWTVVAIDADNSYWRLRGRIRERLNTGTVVCGEVLDTEIPLRLVSLVQRSVCENVQDHARAAATAMRGVEKQLCTALSAMQVVVSTEGIDVDTRSVYAQEYGGGMGEPGDSLAMVAIDLTVKITGKQGCLDVCGDPVDIVCKVIETASNDKVVECLGSRLSEICDTTPCDTCEVVNAADPSEVVACIEAENDIPIYLGQIIDSDQATADLIVEAIGNAGKTEAVQALICEPCPMTVNVTVNGDAQPPIEDVNPCEDNTLTINITYNG